ncbi:MAG: hypothetical protein RL703_953, partial [Pseudomonadota bacterium]
RPPAGLPVVPELDALLPANRSAVDSGVRGNCVGNFPGILGEAGGVGAGLMAAVRDVCRSRAEDFFGVFAALGVVARAIGWLAVRNVTLMARSLRSGSLMP